jgi:hypothetical protein
VGNHSYAGVRVLGLEPRTHGLKDRCAIASACYLSAFALISAFLIRATDPEMYAIPQAKSTEA